MVHWDLVDNDLHSEYGIDVWDDKTLESHSWPWFKRRIMGLMATDSRIANWAKHKAKSS